MDNPMTFNDCRGTEFGADMCPFIGAFDDPT